MPNMNEFNKLTKVSRASRSAALKIAEGDEDYLRELQMLPYEMEHSIGALLIHGTDIYKIADYIGYSTDIVEALVVIGLADIQNTMVNG